MTPTPSDIATIIGSALLQRFSGVGVQFSHTTTGSEMVIVKLMNGPEFNITITKSRHNK